MADSTDDKVLALRQQYLTNEARTFDERLSSMCESPIERLLLAQMLSEYWDNQYDHTSWMGRLKEVEAAGIKPTSAFLFSSDCPCTCVPQAGVSVSGHAYRIDFAFIGSVMGGASDGAPIRIAVELDGHDFHERTKEQASRDKMRDRILMANGWMVLRFTGSDVYRDPAAVMAEVRGVASKLCFPWMGTP